MKIKGIKIIKPTEVDLSKYFDGPMNVSVRPLTVVARAKIQELTTTGVRYATKQMKRSLDINAIEQIIPAEISLEIRAEKLKDGVVAHDFVDEETGKVAVWEKALWDALDEVNPEILEKVLEKITDVTYPEDEEEGADPTSPAKSGKKSKPR